MRPAARKMGERELEFGRRQNARRLEYEQAHRLARRHLVVCLEFVERRLSPGKAGLRIAPAAIDRLEIVSYEPCVDWRRAAHGRAAKTCTAPAPAPAPAV